MRAKVKVSDASTVEGKINFSIFEYAQHANNLGIPVLAGFPVTQRLQDLCNPSCIWLQINYGEQEEHIFNVRVVSNEVRFLDGSSTGIRQLQEPEIVDLINNYCTAMEWEKALEIMNELRKKIRTAGSGLEILTMNLRTIVHYSVFPFSYFKT